MDRHTVRFPNAREYVPVARRTAMEFARELGLPDCAHEELSYAVGEALANAVEHGFRERTYFAIHVAREADTIRVEIEDDGRGFDPDSRTEPEESAARGYGIMIMRAMADRVSFERNGRLVRLWKAISAGATLAES